MASRSCSKTAATSKCKRVCCPKTCAKPRFARGQERQETLEQIGQSFSRDELVRAVAEELKSDAATVEASLFADLKSEQRLTSFHDTTAERLLERYNVALAQALLLRSTGVEVTLKDETPARYRQLFREIKFRRLICDIELIKGNSYRLRLDGPLSLFSATQKYGLQLALLLPTLLLCKHFELEAKLRWGAERKEKRFHLSHKDGLISHQAETGAFVPPEAQMFVELFKKKSPTGNQRSNRDHRSERMCGSRLLVHATEMLCFWTFSVGAVPGANVT